ncbi:MAG: hypothetical protein QMB94_12875 [Phycisphaerales bacterium]
MKHDEHESVRTSDMSSDLKADLDPMRSPGAWMQAFAAGFMSSEVGTNDADDGEAIVASWMERGRAGLEPIEARLTAMMTESSAAAIAASEARVMERLDRIESRLSELERSARTP